MANVTEEQEAQSVIIQRGCDPSHQSLEWIIAIMDDEGEPSNSNNTTSGHKIQNVPKMLREMQPNKSCYDPEVVSIGPFHHQNLELKSFEKFKTQLMRDYVRNCTCGLPTEFNSKVAEFYKKVADVACEARKCYAEGSTENYDDPTFTQMMILDGCFILQFIFCNVNTKGKQEKLKMKSHDRAFVRRDLFLLENQLPFVVLETLMTLRFEKSEGLKYINEFINNIIWCPPPVDSFLEKVKEIIPKSPQQRNNMPSGSPKDEPSHLLDLIRRQLVDPDAINIQGQLVNPGDHTNTSSSYSYRTVKELTTAGIHFKPIKTSYLFTDARYEDMFLTAILRLPRMVIDDSTESLLLNLVAYEMCPDGPDDLGVTSYLWFIDTLIDRAEDVQELRKKGILLNYLGSDELVAELFNRIAKNLVPNPVAYKDLQQKIEKHYRNRLRLWVNEGFNTHFSSPWTIIAFLGAILALALSLIQAFPQIVGRN